MKWTLEEAQKQLSLIINATSQEPQLIYTQEELVAAIVDPELFKEFLNWFYLLPQKLPSVRVN
ncbi:MAG: hypothetical protein RMX65_002840 [Nostoc sp. DedQUE01]|nr:hypothetical protein [Nostoc sp. DedQUE11]MDZ8075862.1 hypothetical protein [Nostoc sp. DedQUE01]